jgi:hypothetical protein
MHPWERQDSEPPNYYRIFGMFLLQRPRSVRAAVAAAWHEDERTVARHIPGNIYRASRRWRWEERAAAYDAHLATLERAAFERRRVEARRRRIERVARLSALLDHAIGGLEAGRFAEMPPERLLAAVVAFHEHEERELLDEPEDRRKPGASGPVVLPALEDRVI